MAQDRDAAPKGIPSLFRLHKECDWTLVGGVKQRMFQGDVYDVLFFKDNSCTVLESLPLDEGSEYVVLGDSLRKEMGWGRNSFWFGGAKFFRTATLEGRPDVGIYMPTFFLVNEHGRCDFSASSDR